MYFFCTIFNFDIYFFFTVIRSHNVIENMNDSVNANIPQYIHVHVYVLHFKMYNVTFLCIVIFQQKVAKLIQNPRLKKKKPPGYANLQPTSPSPEEGHFCS